MRGRSDRIKIADLEHARLARNLSVAEACEIIGCRVQTYYAWMRKVRQGHETIYPIQRFSCRIKSLIEEGR